MNPRKFFKNKAFSLILSIAFMLAFCIIAFVFSTKAGILSGILFACYIIYALIYSYFGSGDVKNNLAGKSLASHTFDFISDMDVPVLLCDSHGAVSWYNEALKELYPDANFKIGDPGSAITPDIDIAKFETARKSDKKYLLGKTGDRFYRICPYYIETMRKSFWLIIWHDSTDYEKLSAEYYDSNVIVAYAAVDNINELSSGLQQDRYREISAKISNVLNEWVNSMHGIIKEFERDKYLIFFEDRYLESQIESKFDILDKINELSDENVGVPLTMSIGVARMYEGGLAEKEHDRGLFGGQWRKMGYAGYDEQNVSKADADMVFDIYHRLLEQEGGWQRVMGYFKAVNPGIIEYGSEQLINSIYDMVLNKNEFEPEPGMDAEGAILARAIDLVETMISSYMQLAVLQRSGADYGNVEDDPEGAERRRRVYEWQLAREKYRKDE